jgi:hypothetical protein
MIVVYCCRHGVAAAAAVVVVVVVGEDGEDGEEREIERERTAGDHKP